jgi:hypothetical protein
MRQALSIVEIAVILVVTARRRYPNRTLRKLRSVMTRLARGWTLRRIAAELGWQSDQVGEDVGTFGSPRC